MDEIDFVRRLHFSKWTVFASIGPAITCVPRSRTIGDSLSTSLGVATPTDLIRDSGLTPFNVGVRVDIEDFTRDEVAPLRRSWKRRSHEPPVDGPDPLLDARTPFLTAALPGGCGFRNRRMHRTSWVLQESLFPPGIGSGGKQPGVRSPAFSGRGSAQRS